LMLHLLQAYLQQDTDFFLLVHLVNSYGRKLRVRDVK
jgi:hypothetical protein